MAKISMTNVRKKYKKQVNKVLVDFAMFYLKSLILQKKTLNLIILKTAKIIKTSISFFIDNIVYLTRTKPIKDTI